MTKRCANPADNLFANTEIHCPPLMSQVVNNSGTAIGVVVNVSCQTSYTLSEHLVTPLLVSSCDDLGRWQPAVPDCIGKIVYVTKF